MSVRLDPDEALAGPLYAVAALLFLIPAADFLFSIPPAEFSSLQWRFTTVGLLSAHLVMPILGLSLAFVVSSIVEHHTIQRVLVVACFVLAVVWLLLAANFFLDVSQVRGSVGTDELPAVNSASKRAMARYVLSAIVIGYLGWRARRMIPARNKHRATPKPVHVVSK